MKHFTEELQCFQKLILGYFSSVTADEAWILKSVKAAACEEPADVTQGFKNPEAHFIYR